jgi:hypothetical protein
MYPFWIKFILHVLLFPMSLDMLIAKIAEYGVLKFPVFSVRSHYSRYKLKMCCEVSCGHVINLFFFSEVEL